MVFAQPQVLLQLMEVVNHLEEVRHQAQEAKVKHLVQEVEVNHLVQEVEVKHQDPVMEEVRYQDQVELMIALQSLSLHALQVSSQRKSLNILLLLTRH
jgi:hypothetical protein